MRDGEFLSDATANANSSLFEPALAQAPQLCSKWTTERFDADADATKDSALFSAAATLVDRALVEFCSEIGSPILEMGTGDGSGDASPAPERNPW